MTDIVRAVVEPSEMRIGQADRDRYMAHLSDCYARGYLTQDEMGRRCDAAAEAVTLSHLTALVADLPPLPVDRRVVVAEARRRWRRRLCGPWVHFTGHGLALVVALLVLCAVPAIASTNAGWNEDPVRVAVFIGGWIIGGISVIVDIAWFWVWAYKTYG